MTATLTNRTRRARTGSHETIGVQVPTRRRNLPLALVAAICMVGSTLAFVSLHLASGDRVAVLAIARPVRAGDVLAPDDLHVAHITVDPALRPVPLDDKSAVIGRRTAVDLVAGQLLVTDALGEDRALQPGEVIVGIEVDASRAPVDALRPGDWVKLAPVADPAADGTLPDSTFLASGRVLRASAAATSATATQQLSVAVSLDQAPRIAKLAANGRITVMVTP